LTPPTSLLLLAGTSSESQQRSKAGPMYISNVQVCSDAAKLCSYSALGDLSLILVDSTLAVDLLGVGTKIRQTHLARIAKVRG
jgi:hypothetical protein